MLEMWVWRVVVRLGIIIRGSDEKKRQLIPTPSYSLLPAPCVLVLYIYLFITPLSTERSRLLPVVPPSLVLSFHL